MPCHDSYPVYDMAGAYAELLCESLKLPRNAGLSPRLDAWARLHARVDETKEAYEAAKKERSRAAKRAAIGGMELTRNHPADRAENAAYRAYSDAKQAERLWIIKEVLKGKYLHMS